MKKYIILDKKVGETPLVVLEKFKASNPRIADKKLAYAGRLDPMASGKLLVLIGDECKKQDKYLKLDKEYMFEVLIGFKSDTGDVLGLASADDSSQRIVPTDHKSKEFTDKELKEVARKLEGEQNFPFPRYSSKTVQGKPLHVWSVEGRIDEIEIPHKASTIHSLHFNSSYILSKEKVSEKIFEKINSIPEVTEESKALGRDFRREEIRDRWSKLFIDTERKEFQIARFTCVASSGTYMRTLAGEIGKLLGAKGLAYSIHRTRIGLYKKVFSNWSFWIKIFR